MKYHRFSSIPNETLLSEVFYETFGTFPYTKSKPPKKEHTYNEHGAHFKYSDLFSRLLDLFTTLPKERLGYKGMLFQEETKSTNELPNNTNNTNIPFLIENSTYSKQASKSRNLVSPDKKNLFMKTTATSSPNRKLAVSNLHLFCTCMHSLRDMM